MTAAADQQAARRRAARPGGSHDTVVTMLKLLLPTAAIALLALIVIWPLTSAREFSFLLSKDKVEMANDRLRLDNAVYRGQTGKGQPFVIKAGGAVQHSSAVPIVELRVLDATIQMEEGPTRVTAPTGRYDMDRDRLDIAGPVKVDGEAGYALDSQAVVISLVDRTVATDQPVTGKLPIGTFRSDRLSGDLAGRTMLLQGHAHLHILGASARRSPR